MKKSTILVLVIVVIVAVILGIVLVMNNSSKEATNLKEVKSNEDLITLVNDVYNGSEAEITGVETLEIDLTDETSVKSYTGLDNADSLEYAVVSEPLISSIPYSLVAIKVKNNVNANEIAKAMSENIDMRKWICVSAEKLYATNSGNIVFLVMAETDRAKSVYDSFKNIAGTVGKEYEKEAEVEELPPDMLAPETMIVPEDVE